MNQLKCAIAIGVIGTVLISPAVVNANLLINGSFEDGAFSGNKESGSVDQVLYTDSPQPITGWTVTDRGQGDIAWELNSNPWDFKTLAGEKFLDLTGYANDAFPHGEIALSQAITTVSGEYYNLSFDIGSSQHYNFGYSNPEITVTVNGTQYKFSGNINSSDISGQNNHWDHASFNFEGTGENTDISFKATTPGDINVLLLDNVSLTAVPEPTTLIAGALLLLPFGASTLRIVRRNKLA